MTQRVSQDPLVDVPVPKKQPAKRARGPRRPWFAYVTSYGTRMHLITAHSPDDAYERTVKNLDTKPHRDEVVVRRAVGGDIVLLDVVPAGSLEDRTRWADIVRKTPVVD